MKRITGLMFVLLAMANGFSQQVMLKDCFAEAEKNYPLLIQQELWQQSFAETNAMLNKNWLPQVDLNAQATYQSDVTQVAIPLPRVTIPTIEKDQYKATVDIKQMIWDGGSIGKEREVKRIENGIEQQKVAVDLLKLKERITQLYFRILMLDESISLGKLAIADLSTRLNTIEAGIRNGVVMQSGADRLNVEILRQKQRISELEADRVVSIGSLALFTGKPMAKDAVLGLPQVVLPSSDLSMRPELKLFDLQQQQFNARIKAVTTKNLPRMNAFVQGGYGRPGLNMFDPDFQFFYIAGLRLNWQLWSWNTGANEKKIYSIAGQIVEKQKNIFSLNTTVQLQQQEAEVTKLESLLINDDEIIRLQTSLKKNASTQFDNGTLSANDYLLELNAETLAKLNKKLHEIQLVMAKINYQLVTGNLTF